MMEEGLITLQPIGETATDHVPSYKRKLDKLQLENSALSITLQTMDDALDAAETRVKQLTSEIGRLYYTLAYIRGGLTTPYV
jgi:predicted nuclease with TOPRIM domain